MNNLPTLTKQTLFELLSQRFKTQDKKLKDIPSPTLLLDANKSAKKITDAIREKKKITLVGDYDVDGVTSCAIVADFFRQIPYPINIIIPNRFRDGYGVSPSVLQRVDADLVITVDNGISALEAADICKQRGIELIITDHHTPSEILPDAYAIVDPKLPDCQYPFKEICGAQVAWLLLGLVKKELQLNINMKEFLDILAIAIIADIMPLIDINRTLVKEGLKVLMHSNRPASIIIRDFLDKASITSEDVAFQIAPRINSAGRLEDASIALDFFMASTTEIAFKQFELLTLLNTKRKETEADATKEAVEMVEKSNKIPSQAEDDSIFQPSFSGLTRESSITVVAKEGWHEGVVGIVAARLVDKFSKPAIVLSIKDGVAKGSARSIGEVSIYELIKENEHLLTKFGGHRMAAGLGLEETKIDLFIDAINKSASKLNPDDFIPKEKALGILSSDEIDLELLDLLESFEPYGEANARPSFLFKDAEVVSIKLMGSDKSHSRIEVRQYPHQRNTVTLIAFRKVFEMPDSRKISCSYTVTKNEFNGKISPQLLLNKIY